MLVLEGQDSTYMYKKAIGLLLLCNLIVLSGSVCVREIAAAQTAAGQTAAKQTADAAMFLKLEEMEEKANEREALRLRGSSAEGGIGIAGVTVSGQRVVSYGVVEPGDYRFLDEDELEVLLRIVEAEAGTEDVEGKLLVANVVLNRVDSDRFPGTVTEVVFQQSEGVTQFSPVASGRIHTVEVSEETVTAVERALAGEDISEGALFFAARKYASSQKMKWFDEKLTFLFSHGGHEFYK